MWVHSCELLEGGMVELDVHGFEQVHDEGFVLVLAYDLEVFLLREKEAT
jgi:hypothetical protein